MSASMPNQHTAYATNQRGEETVRETEARALLSCAQKLEDASLPETSVEDFKEAVHHNQKLWTIFQSCLVDKENPLPNELKTTILNLSVYVDKTSFTALAERNKGVLKSLVSINRNLAAGLSINPAVAAGSTKAVEELTDRHASVSTSA